VNAITNLALLTGNVGRPGASAISLAGQSNSLGAREAGCAGGLPGFRRFESPADRDDLARLWRVPPGRIPARRGLAYPEIVEAMLAGDVRALWVVGADPLTSYPNAEVLHRALERLEFLAVQDGFHPTPTSTLAHLVLPAAIWGEKEGTCTSSERRVSRVRRAVDPPGEARSDFDIFLDVARAAGCAEELFPGWTSPRDAFEEWRRVSAGRTCDCSGMSWEAIEQAGGIQWPYPAGAREPLGVRRLYAEGCFPTATGLGRFVPVGWEAFPEQPSRDYPLVLNTGRILDERDVQGDAPPWIAMHPDDARVLGLKARHHVNVLSRRGRVPGLRLRLTDTVAPGQVFLPVPQAAPVNVLTQSLFDPVSRGPNYKQCAVRVERAAARRRWWRRTPRPRPMGGKQS